MSKVSLEREGGKDFEKIHDAVLMNTALSSV